MSSQPQPQPQPQPETVTAATDIIDKAVSDGQLKVIEFLLVQEMKPTQSAIDRAAANGHLDTVIMLYQHGFRCSSTGIEAASANGHTSIVEFLLTKGIRYDIFHQTQPSIEMVKTIYQLGSKVDSEVVYRAVKSGQVDVVQFLSENGYQFTQVDLKNAIQSNQTEIAKVLLGQKISVTNWSGVWRDDLSDLFKAVYDPAHPRASFSKVDDFIRYPRIVDIVYDADESSRREIIRSLLEILRCNEPDFTNVEKLLNRHKPTFSFSNNDLCGCISFNNLKHIEFVYKHNLIEDVTDFIRYLQSGYSKSSAQWLEDQEAKRDRVPNPVLDQFKAEQTAMLIQKSAQFASDPAISTYLSRLRLDLDQL